MSLDCKICNKNFESIHGLTAHIFLAHKLKKECYYLQYINPVKPMCQFCNVEPTKFSTLQKGYDRFCSHSCSFKYGARKQWENNPERREKTSILAKARNLSGSFGKGRPKGAKNKNPYKRKVNPEYKLTPEQSERRRNRFRSMNLSRTDEDWARIIKNRKYKTQSQHEEYKYTKDDFTKLLSVFDMDENSWDIKQIPHNIPLYVEIS